MSEQTQATAIEVTQVELQQQVKELQDMLHGYENELNAASDAHNATIDELAKVRAELECVRRQLVEMTAKERNMRIAFDKQVAENAEMMREIDEYAALLGTKEQQYDMLKILAKPLLEQFTEGL